jgi:CubicO group peptidase (beta-lactamase class C family)
MSSPRVRLQVILFSALALILPASVWAQTPSLAGHWVGAIEVPSAKLEVDLDFSQNPDGTWKGDISIPAQNAKDLPLDRVEVQGLDVAFVIKDVPGNPAFKGRFGPDGQSISGTMTQGGLSFPFSLKRGETAAAKAQAALAGFDKVVERGLKALNVAGTAVAVVSGQEVVFCRGFGFRDVEAKLPMTPDTLLAIGSSSKAFTAFALGTLVDAGKLAWDKPVRTYIPWFRLYDSAATERITPRDLVTHRSGLPRHDLVWYNNSVSTRDDLVRRLAFLKPTADLRERFQYNNLMFLTAGYLLEVLTGKSWEEAVRARVLVPLGMTRTNFSVEDSQKDADFAAPYRDENGSLKRIPFRNITTVGPAGSINSSVREMSRWVLVHLNQGKSEGASVMAPATLAEMHAAHMPMGTTQTTPEVTPPVYGLGWMRDSFRGRLRVHHGGNIDGFSALVSFFPQDNLGFVILSNTNGSPLGELLVRHGADLVFGSPSRDWIGEAAGNRTQGAALQKEAEKKKSTRRTEGTAPSHKLEDYAGDYVHPGYGDLKVVLRDGRLAFVYNGITTGLAHWHYETFTGRKVEDPTFDDMKLTFRTDSNGFIASVEAPFEPTLEEIAFARKPEARLSDPAFLASCEGRYDLGPQRIAVTLKGATLVVQFPGQPPADLIPGLGGEFTLKPQPTVGLKFKGDGTGRMTSLEIYQPSGVFEAKRAKD